MAGRRRLRLRPGVLGAGNGEDVRRDAARGKEAVQSPGSSRARASGVGRAGGPVCLNTPSPHWREGQGEGRWWETRSAGGSLARQSAWFGIWPMSDDGEVIQRRK